MCCFKFLNQLKLAFKLTISCFCNFYKFNAWIDLNFYRFGISGEFRAIQIFVLIKFLGICIIELNLYIMIFLFSLKEKISCDVDSNYRNRLLIHICKRNYKKSIIG